jgi:hypothetical protein
MPIVGEAGRLVDGRPAARQGDEGLAQGPPVHDRRFADLAVEHLRVGRSVLLLDHLTQGIINQVRAVDARRVAPVRVPGVGVAEVVGFQVAIPVIPYVRAGNGELVCGGSLSRRSSP